MKNWNLAHPRLFVSVGALTFALVLSVLRLVQLGQQAKQLMTLISFSCSSFQGLWYPLPLLSPKLPKL
jgi:hypothetical protein